MTTVAQISISISIRRYQSRHIKVQSVLELLEWCFDVFSRLYLLLPPRHIFIFTHPPSTLSPPPPLCNTHCRHSRDEMPNFEK